MNTSGILRNTFSVVLSGLQEPRGFVYDYNRMPVSNSIDNGTAVRTGSYWDGSNKYFKDRYNIPEISGRLVLSWHKLNQVKGLPQLIAGHGDNKDLQFSGINLLSTNNWQPRMYDGIWFDLDQKTYLYDDEATEVILSGLDKTYLFENPVKDFTPISLATFYISEWGRVREYETFNQKLSFTSTDSTEETLTQVPGTDPPLYEQRYTSIRWNYVDSGLFEFMYDPVAPGIVRSRNITSGVQADLTRVPWSQSHIQLPLVPVIGFDTIPLFHFKQEMIKISGGLGEITVAGSGVSNLVVTSGSYVRVSGSWDEASGILPVIGTISGVYPASGSLLIDDNDYHQEVLDYSAISGVYFSGLTRTSGVTHRDGAQVRLIVSGATLSGNYVSGVTGSGMYYISYDASGIQGTLNKKTGLWNLPELSGSHRVNVDVNYTRGMLLCYTQSGLDGVASASGVNINPLLHGTNHGILYASRINELYPAKIKLSTGRGVNTDGTVGPIYAGNDYLTLEAEVLSQTNSPVPGSTVTLVLEKPSEIGLVDGLDPADAPITKVTDGSGKVRFTYTPPDTIQGLGYFADTTEITNSSGLQFRSTIPLNELWESGTGWTTLFFSVWDEDEYLTASETSGLFDYTADGRFELVSQISGTDANGISTWLPVQPIAAFDENGAALTYSSTDEVKTLVFPSGSIPTDGDIISYFVSAEKRISIGAAILTSNLNSKSFETIIKIPQFMTGEFYWGPLDDYDTKAFDSLSYLTINPFQNFDIDEERSDPRSLGNVFLIQGTETDEYMRNKFYLGVDIDNLQQTVEGAAQLKQLFAMRNRFILEVE